MSEFTQITIRRGTKGLGRSNGFWSGTDVLINKDMSTIYVLDEKTTTQDLLDTMIGIIDENIRDWVLWDMRRAVAVKSKSQNEKDPRSFFNLQVIPSLQRDEWIKGRVSVVRMLKCWQNDGKTAEQLSQFLANEWITAWRHDANIYPCMNFGVPKEISLARLLTIRWEKLDGSIPLEMFLQSLWNMAEMDFSGNRHLGPGRWNVELYENKENHKTFRKNLRDDEVDILTKYGFDVYLKGEMTREKVRAIVSTPIFSSLCLLILADKGLILPPRNLGGYTGSRVRELGWTKPFERWFPTASNRQKLAPLLFSSTIRDPKDIPANLKDSWSNFAKEQNPHLKNLRRMLLEYGEENDLPTFDISPFESNIAARVDVNMRMWHPQWFRDQGHPDAWCEFAEAAFKNCRSCKREVASKLKALCEWALDRFESPWDITTLNLFNPHNPKNPDTFASYCKKRTDNSGNGCTDPHRKWIGAAHVFKLVKTFVSIPGYPGYREGAVNPFDSIRSPFKANRNKSHKTHRSRIATLIHEKMIEVLLDIDEQGKPSFAWARTQFATEDSHTDGVWCPSRWTALAFLLLLPLRKKQVRWLDQGLMDDKVFDPETFQLVENTHPLSSYTYEDGKTHLQRYGRSSGVIQEMADDFMGKSGHIGLFVNTNKTQLWNPAKKNGYELPWPDGSELLADGDDELRQHGYWLRRVYEVLAYQYRHVIQHDSAPVPVTFTDVRGDINSISADNECAARMPRFVPLFRDTSNRKQLDRDGALRVAAMPVTDHKLENAFVALCMETEARFKAEGYNSVSLTEPRLKKGGSESGVRSRKLKFDIHCLRVAGISRLIEIGIDPVIVQEFVAGHLTLAMTHHYILLQPWHVREKIIEAIVNGDFKSAIETFAEKVAKGQWDRDKTFVSLPRFKDHVANLPEDFACFAVVKGGICVMGGNGDACNEGGVYEQWDDRNEETTEFGPVQGGCGNCIYFRTAAFLLQEQTLVLNVLLAELRAQARERKELRTKISDLICKIDEAEAPREKNRLISDKSLHDARIEELNHHMVPKLTEWVNRYIMLKECEGQLEELRNGNAEKTALVAPFGENIGLSADDLRISQAMTPDIGLIGRIVEGSRVLGARGIVIPEDHARFLERGVDKLLRMNGSQHLLLDVPTSERVHGASLMFNALEDLIGAEAMQEALDSDTPLALPEVLRNDVNEFAGALVGAAKKGRLTVDNLLDEGRICNMIRDRREGDGRWAM